MGHVPTKYLIYAVPAVNHGILFANIIGYYYLDAPSGAFGLRSAFGCRARPHGKITKFIVQYQAMKTAFFFCFVVINAANIYAQANPFSVDTTFIEANVLPETMPYFSGCDTAAKSTDERRACSDRVCMKYITDKLQYPEAALIADIEGTVYVGFDITSEGKVTNVAVLRDIGGGCGDEAMRVIRSMPNWLPATTAGKNVATRMSLPIRFELGIDEPILAPGYTLNWGVLRGEKTTKIKLQENIDAAITVRDERGNQLDINELSFTYERDQKFETAQGNGTITPEMLKIIKRLKKGDTFVVTAVVQRSGKFLFAERSFVIEE